MDIDRLLPAGIKKCLDHMAGIPVSPELVKRKDAVHLEPPGMAGAAGGGNEFSIHKDAEYAFVLRISLLAPVVGPDFFCEREFCGGELAGGGGGHGDHTILLLASSTTNALTMKIPFHRCMMILATIFLIIMIAGCTEKQAMETEIVADHAEELGDQSYNITLGEGVTLLESFVSEDLAIPNATLPIYYALGNEVNEDGKAKGWIFSTEIENDQVFIIVESDRQILVSSTMARMGKTIEITRIVSPGVLIADNKKNIIDAFGKGVSVPPLKIELSNDAYTITPSKGSADRILRFDAFTGKPKNI